MMLYGIDYENQQGYADSTAYQVRAEISKVKKNMIIRYITEDLVEA